MEPGQLNCHHWLRFGKLLLWLLISALFTAGGAASAGDLLNREEREWLAHHPVIRLAYETWYPPFTFLNAQGQVAGLSVEYIRLLEQKLGIHFQIVAPNDLSVNLSKARSGDVDVLTSLMKTPERSGYLLFTKPYVVAPAVIIVRKGFTGPVSLDKMRGVRIAVCTEYAVTKYLEEAFPFLDLVRANNELVSLRMLSLGEVDATVMDMASASHIIQTEGIGNLRVAGDTGFSYSLSLASRKDWPVLNRILEKGLAGITMKESEAIRRNWITLEQAPVVGKSLWIGILTILALAVIAITVVTIGNRTLHRLVAKQTGEMHQELAERRRIEAILQETNAYLENLLDYANAPIIVWDPQFRITRFNHAFEVLTGRREEEVVGQSLTVLFPPEDIEHSMVLISKTLTGERWETVDIRIQHRDGSVRTLLWNSATLFTPDGMTPQATIAQGQDITERKRAETELLQAKEAAVAANRAKSRFLANMSHELRTPMNGVLGMIQLAQSRPLDDQQRHCLDLACTSGRALVRILNDILDLTRIEERKLSLQHVSFPVRKCVSDAVDMLHPEAVRKGLLLTTSVAEGVPETVAGDQVRLKQVLTNLVGNAVKFTEQGIVTVRITPDPHGLTFSVTDTGIGIPADKQDILFQPFSQVDDTDTRRYGGTGLGLAISREIVELMGGTITLASAIGQGSSFSFTIPLAPPPLEGRGEKNDLPTFDSALDRLERGGTTAQMPLREGEAPRILIVEDDPTNRALVHMALAQKHYLTESASNGLQAVDKWEKGAYDLIIMDVQMPVMDGIAAARAIREKEREQGGHIPILAMTAHAYDDDEAWCLASGMDAYLAKPVDLTEVIELVGKMTTPLPR